MQNQTDLTICQLIAFDVEDGIITNAVLTLISAQNYQKTIDTQDSKSQKPRLVINLAGEDGNIFWIVCRCIHALIKQHKEKSACTILTEYQLQKDYNSTINFLDQFVSIINTATS